MFRKKESEFQYHPGIEKIIEDVQGGGTIARKELKGIIKELPPIVVVGRDENGLYHVVKTALIQKVSEAVIEVDKNHVFKVGEAVMIGGDLKGASDLIMSIDKSNADKDVITVAAAIGAGKKGQVLVLAKDKQNANSANFKYIPEVVTMNKVDVTVANQQSGLLVRGTVNESVMPYPVDDAIKALLKDIRFVYKQK
ncbi:hypothetical protein IX307_001362 [Bacteroides pyogenes]|uniref:hypothetical protein n=1 Tax=Bacteroides pyogenes TaxID=310300 RepID=UPI001BA77E05|nr:hypothetical protein [Bacteroides pyogenes]MBR8720214.1 hypothetical protein [Bacteroides pyogenes]MBR8787041.1 hypothetical protein [Bacteroides pyogenes]MBR8792591.1 hypothetical protein [Bacteroides pyogenes]